MTSVDQQMSLTHSFDTLNLLGTIGGNVENVPIAYTFKIPTTHTPPCRILIFFTDHTSNLNKELIPTAGEQDHGLITFIRYKTVPMAILRLKIHTHS